MSHNKRFSFKVIESLLVLVAVSITSGFLAPTLSLAEPVKPERIKQATEILREVGEAFNKCATEKEAPNCSVLPKNLVDSGYLKSLPVLPEELTMAKGSNADFEEDDPGTIGGLKIDGKANIIISIYPVSIEFCKAFNDYHGIGYRTIGACSVDSAGCSGSTSYSDVPAVNSAFICISSGGDVGDLRYYTSTQVPN